MSRFWNKRVHALRPYVPGEQPSRPMVKLNTNESPYPPSPRALAAIRDAADENLRLYPDPEATALRQAIAARHGLGAENVFVGNGSDEVLAHAFRALLQDREPALFADVTYGFYPVYCALYDQPYQVIPLRPDFTLNVEDYVRPSGGIVIANPNAHTGLALPASALETLLEAQRECTVIIDEAYVDFGAQSAVGLIKRFDNLLVVRTLSKSSGLAGLRVGYALGAPGLIEGLNRVKDSFNSYPLSRTSQAGAIAAIEDVPWLQETVRRIAGTRDALAETLARSGFEVLPSRANFLLMRHPGQPAEKLAGDLRARGILVRHLSDTPRLQDWLRVTIGTEEECQVLVEALHEILRDAPEPEDETARDPEPAPDPAHGTASEPPAARTPAP
ncbi:histidinol-phosphate transaminase [Oecophyllibacter saccharovorans]|uniref:Histidinol-phosphate aminotransferase n=1 Tax=Oecophyllibacter saccharovorans TaxID=2558360 RepID=A0A506UMG1_9PROT|nr:histidinol-phosphate transaminase [Oecophyllibacter saccharovorans]TPW34373.1 histidinol-phosphate transaminase [Oecophyllibacter saccharovorans]